MIQQSHLKSALNLLKVVCSQRGEARALEPFRYVSSHCYVSSSVIFKEKVAHLLTMCHLRGTCGFGQTWVTRSRDHVSVCRVIFYLCSFRRLSLKAFFSFAWSVKEMHNFGGTDLGCCGCRWCGNWNM